MRFFGLKGALWEKTGVLLVSDLHWGKTTVFRTAGIPIPEDVLFEDLARLEKLIQQSGASRIIVLGDLIHSPKGLTKECSLLIEDWRRRNSLPIGVVLGNHDRSFRHVPTSWNISNLGEVAHEGPFIFRHEPIKSKEHHVWAGHVHPMLRLAGGHDQVRMPCFWLRQGMTLLPSFSLFTRGVNIRLAPDDRALMVYHEKIYAIGPRELEY